jgi:uncharacterized protein DUF3606
MTMRKSMFILATGARRSRPAWLAEEEEARRLSIETSQENREAATCAASFTLRQPAIRSSHRALSAAIAASRVSHCPCPQERPLRVTGTPQHSLGRVGQIGANLILLRIENGEDGMAKKSKQSSRGLHEVRYAAKKTGKSKNAVKRAVKKVGVSRKKVERELER